VRVRHHTLVLDPERRFGRERVARPELVAELLPALLELVSDVGVVEDVEARV
jgi:hypothetical protein